MARAQTAFLARRDVPSRQSLQQAIDGLKFKLVLDDGYAPFKSSGYLPCTWDGEDAGFDLKFQEVDKATQSEKVQAVLGDRDVAIALRWGGDPREMVSALVVSAALAKNFDALVHDPDRDQLYSADDLVGKARAAASEL